MRMIKAVQDVLFIGIYFYFWIAGTNASMNGDAEGAQNSLLHALLVIGARYLVNDTMRGKDRP